MIGFIGLGVIDPAPLARLEQHGVRAAASVPEIAARCSTVVDLSTTTVAEQIPLKGAQNARAAPERAAAAGNGKKYFPVLVKTL